MAKAQAFDDPGGGSRRRFLLLQGPCGPFFRQLQSHLKRSGYPAVRVAFNGGDLVSALGGETLRYRRSLADWPAWVSALVKRGGFTDLVCYGDCRPYHRAAIAALKPLGVRIHVMEEGYLRPHWVTCEGEGVNGFSKLASVNLEDLDEELLDAAPVRDEERFVSPQWHYMLSGFMHYFWVVMLTALFPRYVSHRDLSATGEAALWLARLLGWPRRNSHTAKELKRLKSTGKPHHLVLLQLNGDSQLREHSDFSSVRHFVEHCLSEYAASASREAVLVFKNHPLDNGVINLARLVRQGAIRHGLLDRVFFIDSGKLVPLLDGAVSVTSINSTACHQPLRRGIPTLVLGRAVFNHPELTPRMRLAHFFKVRPLPDGRAYQLFVRLLQATCQVHGGYYSREARSFAVPGVAQLLIDGNPDPAQFMVHPDAAPAKVRA